MHRGVGIAAADPPDPMSAEAARIQETDFARALRFGYVESAQPRAKWLIGLYRVGERLRIIIDLARILRHRPDIRPVNAQQNIAVDLQMMRAGIFRCRDKCHRLWMRRIAHIDNGKAVGKHMADIGITFVDDDLHSVQPAALIATRYETDVFRARS